MPKKKIALPKPQLPTIQPTMEDPACLDFRRMPKGMLDPVYDEKAMEGYAMRDAATFMQCHQQCQKKACRTVGRCMATPDADGTVFCASPALSMEVMKISAFLWVHAGNLKERHRAWAIARDFGAQLTPGDPHEGLAGLPRR